MEVCFPFHCIGDDKDKKYSQNIMMVVRLVSVHLRLQLSVAEQGMYSACLVGSLSRVQQMSFILDNSAASSIARGALLSGSIISACAVRSLRWERLFAYECWEVLKRIYSPSRQFELPHIVLAF